MMFLQEIRPTPCLYKFSPSAKNDYRNEAPLYVTLNIKPFMVNKSCDMKNKEHLSNKKRTP